MADQSGSTSKASPKGVSAAALDRLVTRIRACRACKTEFIGTPLPHEPRPVLRVKHSARLAICGQAPGTRVHQSGMPFTDPSGDRLRDWLGLDDAQFYDDTQVAIVPMGFCFPGQDKKGGDLPPRRECAPLWRDAVMAQLANVELILLVGGYAQKWHLGAAASPTLTATVANWKACLDGNVAGDGRRYLPLPHPSWRNNGWLRKNPWFSEDVLPRLRREVSQLVGPSR